MNEENINTEATETEQVESETITMTKAELEALLQKTGDQRVSQALKTQEKKNAEKLKEAQKVAAMNEEQKYVYQLEQREKQVAEKERALALAEMKNEASKILSEKGISLQLVDFVVNEDAEVTNANINILDKAFKQSVKAEVEKRLGSKTPKVGYNDEAINKESFKKMSIAERQILKQRDPTEYERLKNMK